MAKKQHAWALLTPQAQALLEQSMAQPSGDYVTVMDNDGNETQVAELHGGFALIGNLPGWNAVAGCGMDFAFTAMIQQMQAVGTQMGQPVGVLLAVVDDVEGTEQPDYSQLDRAITEQELTPINAWLVAHGYDVAQSGTARQVVEYVCGLFMDGFTVESVYVA
jgi:hypothetical protein